MPCPAQESSSTSLSLPCLTFPADQYNVHSLEIQANNVTIQKQQRHTIGNVSRKIIACFGAEAPPCLHPMHQAAKGNRVSEIYTFRLQHKNNKNRRSGANLEKSSGNFVRKAHLVCMQCTTQQNRMDFLRSVPFRLPSSFSACFPL